MMYVWLILGFILLIKGADWFVDGSSSIAKLLKVSPLIIGLTIVAMGTSAPEAAVSLSAALNGENDIAFSNVIGSNIFNLLFVLGICSIIKPVHAESGIVKRDIPFSIIITIILLLFCLNLTIGRFEGLALFIVFLGFIGLMLYLALKNKPNDEEDNIKVMTPIKSIIYVIIGLAAIIWGGDTVVNSASEIAESFNISPTLIGLTIVSIGTSLPELVTSIVAARKGQSDIAVGNVIGSNIFNLLFILGFSAVISPLSIAGVSVIDTIILIAVSTMAFLFCFRKKIFSRTSGIVFVLSYLIYTAYIIMR